MAELHAAGGEHTQALRHADLAVSAARDLQSATVLRQCLDRRRGIRRGSGDREAIEAALSELLAEHGDGEPLSDTATRLQTQAWLLLSLKRHDEALASLARLAALPTAALNMAAVTQASIAGLRAGILRDAGRVADAVSVLVAAGEALAPTADDDPWRDRDVQWRTLAFGAASNLAELGRIDEALTWSERGHRHTWARALRRHGRGNAAIDIPATRRELAQQGCALVVPMAGTRRTNVVVVPADGREPTVRQIDAGRGDWHRRFAMLEAGAAQWNPCFLENIETFSAWLGPSLDDAVRGARRLVVVPEGVFALVPWAGLAACREASGWLSGLPRCLSLR